MRFGGKPVKPRVVMWTAIAGVFGGVVLASPMVALWVAGSSDVSAGSNVWVGIGSLFSGLLTGGAAAVAVQSYRSGQNEQARVSKIQIAEFSIRMSDKFYTDPEIAKARVLIENSLATRVNPVLQYWIDYEDVDEQKRPRSLDESEVGVYCSVDAMFHFFELLLYLQKSGVMRPSDVPPNVTTWLELFRSDDRFATLREYVGRFGWVELSSYVRSAS